METLLGKDLLVDGESVGMAEKVEGSRVVVGEQVFDDYVEGLLVMITKV